MLFQVGPFQKDSWRVCQEQQFSQVSKFQGNNTLDPGMVSSLMEHERSLSKTSVSPQTAPDACWLCSHPGPPGVPLTHGTWVSDLQCTGPGPLSPLSGTWDKLGNRYGGAEHRSHHRRGARWIRLALESEQVLHQTRLPVHTQPSLGQGSVSG